MADQRFAPLIGQSLTHAWGCNPTEGALLRRLSEMNKVWKPIFIEAVKAAIAGGFDPTVGEQSTKLSKLATAIINLKRLVSEEGVKAFNSAFSSGNVEACSKFCMPISDPSGQSQAAEIDPSMLCNIVRVCPAKVTALLPSLFGATPGSGRSANKFPDDHLVKDIPGAEDAATFLADVLACLARNEPEEIVLNKVLNDMSAKPKAEELARAIAQAEGTPRERLALLQRALTRARFAQRAPSGDLSGIPELHANDRRCPNAVIARNVTWRLAKLKVEKCPKGGKVECIMDGCEGSYATGRFIDHVKEIHLFQFNLMVCIECSCAFKRPQKATAHAEGKHSKTHTPDECIRYVSALDAYLYFFGEFPYLLAKLVEFLELVTGVRRIDQDDLAHDLPPRRGQPQPHHDDAQEDDAAPEPVATPTSSKRKKRSSEAAASSSSSSSRSSTPAVKQVKPSASKSCTDAASSSSFQAARAPTSSVWRRRARKDEEEEEEESWPPPSSSKSRTSSSSTVRSKGGFGSFRSPVPLPAEGLQQRDEDEMAGSGTKRRRQPQAAASSSSSKRPRVEPDEAEIDVDRAKWHSPPDVIKGPLHLGREVSPKNKAQSSDDLPSESKEDEEEFGFLRSPLSVAEEIDLVIFYRDHLLL